MPDPKGFKLLVNLGASAVRRRLKGYGHGVRKIYSAGKNQAVVIHTATGRHCDELKGVFVDVGWTELGGDVAPQDENGGNRDDPAPPA
ncbi:MAG: hypothetical protein AB7U73_25000 [Pirellulales bacterium]